MRKGQPGEKKKSDALESKYFKRNFFLLCFCFKP